MAVVVLGLAGALLVRWKAAPPGAVGSAPTRLAVLPFENQGPPETDYFAEGMSDEVRGKLASLPGFAVVASTSSNQYKKTPKPMEQVARELDVRYLVVGKVRWERASGQGRVQVVPELVEVERSGVQMQKWRRPFDVTLTDVFQLQTEIAEEVARSLDVALSAGEHKALAEKPTQNLAAYDAFLRGELAYRHDRWRDAANAYEQALRLDPNFALAWAHLSRTHSAWYENAPTPAGARRAREAAERAVALAPERAEGYEARARYHAMDLDNARGLVEIERAERLAPHNVDVLNRKARLQRNLGRWEESLRLSQEAKRLDPRSIFTARDLTLTLSSLRRYPEARAEGDRALALDPTDVAALTYRLDASLGQGDLAGARAVVRAASTSVERAELALCMPEWAFDGQDQELLLTLGPDRFDHDRALWAWARARIYTFRGDAANARENFELARAELEAKLRASPQQPFFRSRYGAVLAYLGRKAEAIAEGERAATLMPLTKHALAGPDIQKWLAQIYVLVGEHEKAIALLEPLLEIPHGFSLGWLRIDPSFASLHGNPRFEKLVRAER
jgi:serine/threonine-protein kinase